ncbi:unnamed protein product [Nesidiocoris tenuis]|uniref:Uncharacterized protein n=1 Tax=Nesidiocoris tenuis TaxID=355587 RepID=A0A6H5GPN2_9HEMI|nr:unnamed protein product [Nesidiocoris tenuis]
MQARRNQIKSPTTHNGTFRNQTSQNRNFLTRPFFTAPTIFMPWNSDLDQPREGSGAKTNHFFHPEIFKCHRTSLVHPQDDRATILYSQANTSQYPVHLWPRRTIHSHHLREITPEESIILENASLSNNLLGTPASVSAGNSFSLRERQIFKGRFQDGRLEIRRGPEKKKFITDSGTVRTGGTELRTGVYGPATATRFVRSLADYENDSHEHRMKDFRHYSSTYFHRTDGILTCGVTRAADTKSKANPPHNTTQRHNTEPFKNCCSLNRHEKSDGRESERAKRDDSRNRSAYGLLSRAGRLVCRLPGSAPPGSGSGSAARAVEDSAQSEEIITPRIITAMLGLATCATKIHEQTSHIKGPIRLTESDMVTAYAYHSIDPERLMRKRSGCRSSSWQRHLSVSWANSLEIQTVALIDDDGEVPNCRIPEIVIYAGMRNVVSPQIQWRVLTSRYSDHKLADSEFGMAVELKHALMHFWNSRRKSLVSLPKNHFLDKTERQEKKLSCLRSRSMVCAKIRKERLRFRVIMDFITIVEKLCPPAMPRSSNSTKHRLSSAEETTVSHTPPVLIVDNRSSGCHQLNDHDKFQQALRYFQGRFINAFEAIFKLDLGKKGADHFREPNTRCDPETPQADILTNGLIQWASFGGEKLFALQK